MVLIALLLIAAVAMAPAKTIRRTDAMGAHLNGGRGCSACHTPHHPILNGYVPIRSAMSSQAMLWGSDVVGTYAGCGDAFQAVALDRSDSRGMLSCLTCHDGNYAPRAMMRGVIYESVPAKYGVGHIIPTLLDKDDLNAGNDIDDHPIGLAAQLRCGGSSGWDCTQTHGVIQMQGALSSKFAANFGYFVKPGHSGDTSLLFCTTCHNPHSMTWTVVTAKTASNLYPAGTYPTKHFLRAPGYDIEFNPANDNRRAQFCRQCHADKSNEMNGSLSSIGL